MVAHHTEDGKISKNTNNRETRRFQNPGIVKIAPPPFCLAWLSPSPPFWQSKDFESAWPGHATPPRFDDISILLVRV